MFGQNDPEMVKIQDGKRSLHQSSFRLDMKPFGNIKFFPCGLAWYYPRAGLGNCTGEAVPDQLFNILDSRLIKNVKIKNDHPRLFRLRK